MRARKVILLPGEEDEIEVWELELHMPGKSVRVDCHQGDKFGGGPPPIESVFRLWTARKEAFTEIPSIL